MPIKGPGFPAVKVGDMLTRRFRGKELSEVEVIRVGRKYITVKLYSREYPYHKDTGQCASDVRAWEDRLVTPEIVEHEARLDAVLARLKAYEIDPWRIVRKVDHVATLEAVADILEAD